MSGLLTTIYIISIVGGSLAIVALLYIISSSRRKSITLKKVDYLVEDLTYKSEVLNPTIETVAKIANYIDVFELIARKNMKSAAKVIARNKDDFYKVIERLKRIAIGPEYKPKENEKKSSRNKRNTIISGKKTKKEEVK